MSKAIALKQIIGTIPAKEPHQTNSYISRLKSEIERTKKYLDQANDAIESLSKDSETEPSKNQRLSALNEAYSKIPYIPYKDDVIDTTITSQKLEGNLSRQMKFIEDFGKEIEGSESEIELMKESIKDYLEMINHIDEELRKSKSSSNESEFELSEETRKITRLLNAHLKVVISKYLTLNNLNHDAESIGSNIKLVRVLLEKSSEKDPWVEVVPTLSNERFIKLLVMKNVFVAKDGSTASRYYIKLRDFSL